MAKRRSRYPIEAVGRKSKKRFTYLVERELGSGAFSRVFKAQRLPGSKTESESVISQVALKIASGPKLKNRLAREAEVLQCLSSRQTDRSRIVRIGAGGDVLECETSDEWMLELEYLDGQTMEDWFDSEWTKTEADPIARVRTMSRLVRGLADALVELSEVDEMDEAILHRDLKQANVMLTSDGLRLFDFNVARQDDGLEDYTEGVGTAFYRAPEVLVGQSYDLRADLYSLGVIAWELLMQRKLSMAKDLPEGAIKGSFVISWPPPELAELPLAVAEPLERLMTGLLTDQQQRLDSPTEVLELLDAIDEALAAPSEPGEEVLGDFDLIQLLFELRPNGLLAVVADTREQDALQRAFRQALQVEDQLEAWLRERLEAARGAERPSLFVLAGNAGDGKSHLIDRLIRQVGGEAPFRYIADATHATHPSQTQQDRLEEFFAPFAPDGEPTAERVSLIAINTGMVIRFFDSAAERHSQGHSRCGDLTALYEALQTRLGLRSGAAPEIPFDLEVVNLDLRNLLSREDGPSFFEQMTSRLDPEAGVGLLEYRWADCELCSARATCPVHFNLEALRLPRVRRALHGLLERATLDPEVHLSPRNLWGFLYRLVTGGQERYTAINADDGPCDVVRRMAGRVDGGQWLLEGQLTEVLFSHGDNASPPLWQALATIDPAFVPAPELDRLHTRLAVQKQRDISVEELGKMGGDEGRLAGLKLDRVVALLPEEYPASRRRDAAIRRRVIFDAEAFAGYRRWDGGAQFEALLEAYDAFSRTPEPLELPKAYRTALIELTKEVGQVFVHGAGRQLGHQRFLHVSQPHNRGTSQLMVRIDEGLLDDLFSPSNLLLPDAHIRALADRSELLRCLAYRPRVITLSLARHRLIVDLALHRFLLQVRDGRKPSRRDLTQFEALFYLGEHIGNALVEKQPEGKEELHVLEGDTGALYRLYRDGFGAIDMECCQEKGGRQ